MLTKHELTTLSWIFKHASFLKSIPFEWNPETYKLSLTTSKWKLVYHNFVNFFGIVYWIYNVTQFRKTFADYKTFGRADDVIIHGWYFVAQSIVLTINGTFWVFRYEIMNLVNKSLEYNFKAGKKHFNREFKPSHWREKVYWAVEASSHATGTCFGILWVVNPGKHYAKYSGLVPDAWKGLPMLIATDCVEMVQTVTWSFSWTSFCTVLYLHFFGIKYWLKNCCFEWDDPEPKANGNNQGHDQQLEHDPYLLCERSFSTYKVCYLLNDMFNEIFSPAAIPGLKYLTVLLFAFPLFGFIRFHGTLDLLTSCQVLILIPAAGLSLIPASLVMSEVYNFSVEFPYNMPPNILKSTKEGSASALRKVYLGQLKSVLPVRCKVGSMYYMERQAKLTLLDSIVSVLVFLLLNC